jgi:hypothetical protein
VIANKLSHPVPQFTVEAPRVLKALPQPTRTGIVLVGQFDFNLPDGSNLLVDNAGPKSRIPGRSAADHDVNWCGMGHRIIVARAPEERVNSAPGSASSTVKSSAGPLLTNV